MYKRQVFKAAEEIIAKKAKPVQTLATIMAFRLRPGVVNQFTGAEIMPRRISRSLSTPPDPLKIHFHMIPTIKPESAQGIYTMPS